ncbi:glycosyltransferase [Candidatus Woesearchaeota archaeon]|nr:glycosyltransferase [Candidatus Woesearchaeota archaeon]
MSNATGKDTNAARYAYKSGKVNIEAGSVAELRQGISRVAAVANKHFVSVVVPTYNEEGNVGRLIGALSLSLESAGINYFEIIVVDDDSRDETPSIIDKSAASGRVAAVHRYNIRGIFSAIMDGVKVARGDLVVIMDADASHPPSKVPELIKNLVDKNLDMVSASRFMAGGGIEAPFLRKAATVLFNSVIRFVMGHGITDWTGGFHAIRRAKLLALDFRYPSKWGEFDLELLYRAMNAGFSISEVPFVYNFREEGKSKSAERLGFLFGYAWLYGKRMLQLRFSK